MNSFTFIRNDYKYKTRNKHFLFFRSHSNRTIHKAIHKVTVNTAIIKRTIHVLLYETNFLRVLLTVCLPSDIYCYCLRNATKVKQHNNYYQFSKWLLILCKCFVNSKVMSCLTTGSLSSSRRIFNVSNWLGFLNEIKTMFE